MTAMLSPSPNHAQQAYLDSMLMPSKISCILELVFVVLVLVIGLAGQLPLWQGGVLLLIATAIIISSRRPPYQVVHLVHLPAGFDDKTDNQWQLGVTTQHGKQVWQANLTHADDKGIGILLTFNVYEPMTQTMSLTVYADQLPKNHWRQLKNTVRFFMPSQKA